MKIKDLLPVLIYDNNCYYCSKFASIANFLAAGKIIVIGHYTKLGREIKNEIFPKDYESTRMFWFITKKTAYGGRAGILPLFYFILRHGRSRHLQERVAVEFGTDCKDPRAFLARITSLLSNSEKINLRSFTEKEV